MLSKELNWVLDDGADPNWQIPRAVVSAPQKGSTAKYNILSPLRLYEQAVNWEKKLSFNFIWYIRNNFHRSIAVTNLCLFPARDGAPI